jgi:hypothetical protein
VLLAVVGVALVMLAKMSLVWTYRSAANVRTDGPDPPNHGYTLEGVANSLQYFHHSWRQDYNEWLLWTVLTMVGALALLGLTVARRHALWRATALAAGAGGAALSIVQAYGLVGVRMDTYPYPPFATFQGVGPGPFAAAVGFLLLGCAPWLAGLPTAVARGPRWRMVLSGSLVGGGVALMLVSVNVLKWWNTHSPLQLDENPDFGFHEVVRHYRYSLVKWEGDALGNVPVHEPVLFFLRYVIGPMAAVAVVAIVAVLLRPDLGRFLRPVAGVAAVLLPVLTFGLVAGSWPGVNPSPVDPANLSDGQYCGFWVLAAGSALLAAAAIAAPGQKTTRRGPPAPTTPKSSIAASGVSGDSVET